MDWFRCYHGMTEDPKLQLVAALAGVKPGHVVSVWTALMDHASRSRPRGSVETADHEAIAVSLGWGPDQVQAILDALVRRRHIVDGQLRAWFERNPEKYDTTAKNRKRRQREREKTVPASPLPVDEGHDMSRRDERDSHESHHVTPTEEIEQSNCSVSDSFSQDCNTSLKLLTTRTVRGQAGALLNVEQFWQWIGSQGIPAHIGIRTMHRGRLTDWLQQGLTQSNLDDALSRAQRKREKTNNPRPVNIGYLACFVDEVLSGADPQTTTAAAGGGYGRGDELGAKFANAG